MALLRPELSFAERIKAKFFRPAKAKFEGTNYGPSWIHWEPPKQRRFEETETDVRNRLNEEQRLRDLIRGKF